jgi:hypothetical protein
MWHEAQPQKRPSVSGRRMRQQRPQLLNVQACNQSQLHTGSRNFKVMLSHRCDVR